MQPRRHPRKDHRRPDAGVTLLELLIVVGLIALITGLSYPSVNAGLGSLRMRQATDEVGSFLTVALDRADRKQQVLEIQIVPQQNLLTARSSDGRFTRRLQLPEPARILAVTPPVPGGPPNQPRRFLVYPGGATPAIGVELADDAGRRRLVYIDPFTGTARTEAPAQ